MLTYDCCVPDCTRKSIGDSHALLAQLVDVHGPERRYSTTDQHYDFMRTALHRAATRARAIAVKNKEPLLLKHAEELSKQEAVLARERLRYEGLPQQKRA